MITKKIKRVLMGMTGLVAGIGFGFTVANHTFAATTPSVQYQTHVENIGWQGFVADGATAGTTGQSKRLEAIKIKLANQDASNSGSIQYQTHVENIGWQGNVQDGALSGTEGRGLRLEAIRIRLTGNMANLYDVYYRVHAESFGWLGWAKNGADAGTMGYAYRLEAIQIKLVPKNQAAPGSTANPSYTMHAPNINYQTHVQNIGWQGLVANGATAGTTGRALRVEAYKATLSNMPATVSGGVIYRAYVENIGWHTVVGNGGIAGTTGQGLRVEAMALELTGNIKNYYDVYYRVHSENYGWLGWAKDGGSAGTTGRSLRVEAMQIRLVKKGDPAPGGGTSFVPADQKDFIDVASYQSYLTQNDYYRMRDAGIKGVVVKLTEAASYQNPFAATQIAYARNAGMKIAAYHYAWFSNSPDAATEARYFAAYAKRLGLPGDTVMVDDFEQSEIVNAGGDKVSYINSFRSALAGQGYGNVVDYSYQNVTGPGKVVDTNRLNAQNIWIAQYPNNSNPDAARALKYNTTFAAWQYSSQKHFNGLSNNGSIDISIDYTGRFTN